MDNFGGGFEIFSTFVSIGVDGADEVNAQIQEIADNAGQLENQTVTVPVELEFINPFSLGEGIPIDFTETVEIPVEFDEGPLSDFFDEFSSSADAAADTLSETLTSITSRASLAATVVTGIYSAGIRAANELSGLNDALLDQSRDIAESQRARFENNQEFISTSQQQLAFSESLVELENRRNIAIRDRDQLIIQQQNAEDNAGRRATDFIPFARLSGRADSTNQTDFEDREQDLEQANAALETQRQITSDITDEIARRRELNERELASLQERLEIDRLRVEGQEEQARIAELLSGNSNLTQDQAEDQAAAEAELDARREEVRLRERQEQQADRDAERQAERDRRAIEDAIDQNELLRLQIELANGVAGAQERIDRLRATQDNNPQVERTVQLQAELRAAEEAAEARRDAAREAERAEANRLREIELLQQRSETQELRNRRASEAFDVRRERNERQIAELREGGGAFGEAQNQFDAAFGTDVGRGVVNGQVDGSQEREDVEQRIADIIQDQELAQNRLNDQLMDQQAIQERILELRRQQQGILADAGNVEGGDMNISQALEVNIAAPIEAQTQTIMTQLETQVSIDTCLETIKNQQAQLVRSSDSLARSFDRIARSSQDPTITNTGIFGNC